MSAGYSVLWAFLLRKRWQLICLFCGILIPFLIFGKLADDIHDGDQFSWDTVGLHYFHSLSTPQRDAVIAWVTRVGTALSIFPLVGLVLFLALKNEPRHAIFFALATGGAHGLNLLAKAFFARERPSLWLSPAPATNYSFPSGHAMVSMAVAVALVAILWNTIWRWPALICGGASAIAIGLSRIYLGVHYPSDVLGGWCAALLWVCGLVIIFHKSRPAPHQVS